MKVMEDTEITIKEGRREICENIFSVSAGRNYYLEGLGLNSGPHACTLQIEPLHQPEKLF
jgi:hypothetical protein